jgi:hypothetical protein
MFRLVSLGLDRLAIGRQEDMTNTAGRSLSLERSGLLDF